MRSPEWARFGAILMAAVAGSVVSGGCAGRTSPCVPCAAAAAGEAAPPQIASVQANLEEVQVGPSTAVTSGERAFQLSGWYQDGDGNVISGRFPPIEWKLVPATEGSTEPRGLVKVKMAPTAQANVMARLENEAGSFSDQVTIKRWSGAAAAAAAGDVIKAEHGSGLPPNVVLLEEKLPDNTCAWGRPSPSFAVVAVGEQDAIPCSVSFFSASKAAGFQEGITDVSWMSDGANFTLPLTAPVTLDAAAVHCDAADDELKELTKPLPIAHRRRRR